MIRQWNGQTGQFEVIEDDNNVCDIIQRKINAKQIKNLSINSGIFSMIGASLCTMDYINTYSLTSGVGITIFSGITIGCGIVGFNYYREEAKCNKQLKKIK